MIKQEDKLLDINNLVRKGLEAFPDLIFLISHKGTYLDCLSNEKNLSISSQKFIGKKITDIIPKRIAKLQMDAVRKTIETKQMQTLEVSLPIRNKTRYFESRILYFSKEHVVVFVRDITKSKKAEFKLRESESKLKNILASIPDQIVMIDKNFNISFCNDLVKEMYGAPVVGNKCYKLFHGIDDVCEDCHVRKTFEDGKIHHNECDRVGKDGNKQNCWCISNVATEDEKGQPSLVLEISRDITDQKKIEKKVIDLAKFPSENPNPVLRVTSEKIIYANKAAEILFDVREKNSIPAQLKKEIIRSLKKNIVSNIELELKNKVFSFTITPILSEKYANIYGIDITDLKTTEQELKKSERKLKQMNDELETILDSIPAIAFYQDINNHYYRVNQYFADYMNLTKDEMIGRSDYELFTEEQADKFRKINLKVLNSRTSELNFQEMWEGPYGPNWSLTSIIPRFNEDNEVIGIIGFIFDITKQKLSEQKLQESEGILKSLNNAFLKYQDDPILNIQTLINTTGTLMKADCAMYNKIIKLDGKEILKTIAIYNEPSDFIKEDDPSGHICTDVIKKNTDDIIIIQDLDQTIYRKTDENVRKYNLKQYVGCAVRLNGKSIGTFCVVYKENRKISENEKNIIKFFTKSVSIEELRLEATRKLEESWKNYKNLSNEFEIILDSVPASVFYKDTKNNFIRVNKRLANTYKMTKIELEDKNLFDIYSQEVAQSLWNDDLEVIKSGNPKLNYEESFDTDDGGRWALKSKIPYFNENGEIIGVIGFSTDITERKRFEKKIIDLARFPSENPNPVLRMNKEEVMYANKAAQNLFKIGESDKVPILLKDMIIQAMDANITKTAEIELGNQVYSLVITPIKEGNYVNVYGRNITVRKTVERAIQKRNKEISMLLDASRAVLQYSDFKMVAELIFESCINLIGADAGYVALLTPDKKQNRVIFLNPGKLQCEVNPDVLMPIRGMRAKVIKSKKTLYHNDFSDTDWINLLPKGHIPLKNILFAPLIINDEVQGLMGLANREGGFIEEEARLATAFAELASVSLLNSQTLESLEKSELKYKRLSNILEQKVEERTIELKESEEKVQNMITNISDVLLESEPNGILTYISPQIKNIIGYQSEELIGLNFMDFVHLEDLSAFKETADKSLKTKKTVSIECRLKHKKGYFVPVSVRWSMVEINNEFKVFGLVSDNTERKKIDNMIKREIKQLKELDQIRTDLIRRISHELNTPLISILNGSQFLLDSYNDQMSNEAISIVRIIYQGGYRLKEMVNNLITAYELETDQIQLNIKQENLIPIVRECVEEIIFQADKRKIFINIELSNELNIDIDRRMIKKVILNLLSNAIKNTLSNGNIFIKSIEHHNFIEIIIRDTGVGLTKKEKLFIFKKFGKIERFGKGMDVDIEGPGLGLYISSEIVKLHKGEILVKSKGRNKGSTFILRLFLN